MASKLLQTSILKIEKPDIQLEEQNENFLNEDRVIKRGGGIMVKNQTLNTYKIKIKTRNKKFRIKESKKENNKKFKLLWMTFRNTFLF